MTDEAPILLVEDSPSDRAIIARLFPNRVTAVADAEAALDAVRRQSFAAILLASSLPGRSGLDLLRQIRTEGHTTPVVLLTESGEDDLVEAARGQGATSCVVKEPGFERLLAGIVAGAGREARGPVPIVLFEIEAQLHGLLASDVQMLLPAVSITPLPGAPPEVEGVINVHGRVVPVLDLRARLGLPPKELDPSQHLMVVRLGEHLLAVRVDRATDVVQARVTDVPGVGPSVGGMVQLPVGLVFVHDLRDALAPPQLAALATAWGQLEEEA